MTTPSLSPRMWLSACVLALVTLAGCDDTPDPVVDAGTPPVEDAGTVDAGTVDAGAEPWDGGYTVLEERGDWLDRGPHAPCTLTPGTPVDCDALTPAAFDLSACDADALARLEPHGIYQAGMRAETVAQDGGTAVGFSAIGFKLHSDGGADILANRPLVTRQTDGGSFFLASSRSPNAPFTNFAFAGCQTPSPGVITGCFIRCGNGRVSRTGTFEAHRMAWPPGEAESSGGLVLRSESRVELGRPVDVYVAKEHAYVVSLDNRGLAGGLTVFDVSDRSHPIFKTSISIPGDSYWNGVWALGDALYIASDVSGTIVYDISRPAEPVFLRALPSGQFGVHTVLVDGDRLYSADNEGLTRVYDVSRPLEPVLRQTLSLDPVFSAGGPHDHFAYQGRLYISNATSGFSVVDVSNLDDVRHLGQYVHGSYSHHSAVGTFAGRTLAFEGGEFAASHLRVLDVTDPAHIVKIGEHRKRPVSSIHNMILRGDRLYIAWYQEGLRVLDVSNPTKPREVGHFNTYRESDPGRTEGVFEGAYGIRVPGDDFLYVVDSARGLLILDEP
ncbi:LVIVD repeat-containing protein [Pyxidicoccus sp. 3LFB2]